MKHEDLREQLPSKWLISKVLHKKVGLKAALFFHYLQVQSALIEKETEEGLEEFFHANTHKIMADTLFSQMEQINCRKKLKAIGLLEEKRILQHAKVYYKLKLNVLHKLNLEAERATNVCYKSNDTCKYACGLCKESM